MRNILIANRGEIALRILRSARALGYRVTGIYSEADAGAPHVQLADAAVCVGPAAVGASYLNVERILAAARQSGADAVHPGYGLLSENADFAQACQDAGLTFIGPRPETIRAMGDKRRARIAMQAQGVPCVPGYDGEDQSDATLEREAQRIGLPVMVKAAAGGGGRGMRRVETLAELPEAIARARSEAAKAFGDGRLILERAIEHARHVEVQVFADAHGHVIHLGERDCSVQRRFQKVIEEAPSPAVDADLRRRLGETAVHAARSANYLGAGTVEMLLERSGAFYFLEMNTRLQVEHPVTELISGADLVAWQLRVAEGEPLPWTQEQLELRGHAIEVRLYAEDPARGFLPETGRVAQLRLPDPKLVRFDHWLVPGLVIGPHYDALLGKLIAHGADREQARRKLCAALDQLRLLGVRTNQAFLRELLEHEVFVAGEATTDFLDRTFELAAPQPPTPMILAAAAFACIARARPQGHGAAYAGELEDFTNAVGLVTPLLLECDGQRSALSLSPRREAGQYLLQAGAREAVITREHTSRQACVLDVEGVQQRIEHAWDGDRLFVHAPDGPRIFRDLTHTAPERSQGPGSGRALSPMDGAVVDVPVQLGERVQRGQTLVVIEAMKLELRVAADSDGVVSVVHVQRGAQVKARQVLIEVKAGEAAA